MYFAFVASSIVGDLTSPEFLTSLGQAKELAALVTVPEATVHKNGPPLALVHDVWRPREPSRVEVIPNSGTREKAPCPQLWRCV
jgi:hypothetical protein